MRTDKIILGIITGAAIGAALGVLFAPDKGSNTRRKLSAHRDALTTDLEGKFNGFVETVSGKIEAMKQQASHIMENGKTAMQDTPSKSGISVK